MGYFAEHFAEFLSEAIDRNGKKDKSLSMRYAWDFDEKHKKMMKDAGNDLAKSEIHHNTSDRYSLRSAVADPKSEEHVCNSTKREAYKNSKFGDSNTKNLTIGSQYHANEIKTMDGMRRTYNGYSTQHSSMTKINKKKG